jgi:hypothetical protein
MQVTATVRLTRSGVLEVITDAAMERFALIAENPLESSEVPSPENEEISEIFSKKA